MKILNIGVLCIGQGAIPWVLKANYTLTKMLLKSKLSDKTRANTLRS